LYIESIHYNEINQNDILYKDSPGNDRNKLNIIFLLMDLKKYLGWIENYQIYSTEDIKKIYDC
jgi:hypothetical protein